MVHADVFVLHAPGFVFGVAQHLGQTLGDGDAVGVHAAAGDGGTLAQFFLHGYGQSGGLHAHLIQDAGHDALFLTDQGQRQMLAVDILMAHAHGDALRLGHGLAGFFREFVDVHISSTMPLWTGPVRTRAAPRRKVSKIDFFLCAGCAGGLQRARSVRAAAQGRVGSAGRRDGSVSAGFPAQGISLPIPAVRAPCAPERRYAPEGPR